MGKHLLDFFVRTGNHVDADQFAYAAGRGGARIGGGLDRAHVAAHGDADQPGADELLAGQHHVGGLHHGIGGFDRAHQTFCFNQAKGLHHFPPVQAESLPYHK